ncbi:hypothetical protein KGQ20_04080 [Catenulispora sp. NF23]|uniref:Aminoglycoside phosphotransferase n=1 Tax=Catenulispora pinistramenti TaxID=2705254 RepID=A0ABS5KIQ7_9ACTN|nr:hypothetical protein [Catenulispora pinistramenti]MBS2531942.1 hypothetical protein [Catenulispora pinistramenti]MBS2546209.1 hypothetical protein [Catenulispora pinistramenti]
MSRHLIANSIHEHPDAVTVVGWDPELRTYFCDFEFSDGVRKPVAGGAAEEIPRADWLASILADAGICIPVVLVARLRLEKLAASTANAPQLDWRSGEPSSIT